MSVNDEKTKILEEEIVVNEVEETTDLVETDKEAKKAKMMNTGKKVLKVAGVAAVGFVGYLLGTKAGKKSQYNEDEIIDAEFVDVDGE